MVESLSSQIGNLQVSLKDDFLNPFTKPSMEVLTFFIPEAVCPLNFKPCLYRHLLLSPQMKTS